MCLLEGCARALVASPVIDPALRAALVHAAGDAFGGRPVLAAYAFGSRVAGTPRPDSDLDIGYYLDPPWGVELLPVADEMRIADALSRAVGVSVDLRNLGRAPLEVRGRALEEGIRIYAGDPIRRVALERDLLSRYHDYKDVFRQMHEQRLRALAERGL